jgi:hypothetical protein
VQTFTNVVPGTYAITEDDPIVTPGGYALTNLTCVETGINNSSENIDTRTATISLEAGETVTCTFTNTILSCQADLNNNGRVNTADLSILVSQWGECAGCLADLNGNGWVNLADLSILISQWGKCPFASPILVSPLQQSCATMAFSPTTASLAQVGDAVVLRVPLDADGVTFDTVGFLINFDQTLLRVVDAAGDPASQVEPGNLPGMNVVNTASNVEGAVEFAQVIIGGQTGGTFTVATVRFKVIAELPAGGTQVVFVNGQGNTGVFQAGQQLLCEFPEPVTITWQFILTVGRVGTGTVTSAPAGINCGGDCTADYVENTVVTLTAYPGVKSYFVEWSEDCTGTERTITVTMDADETCTATFGYPVGGIVEPVDKLELLSPWLALASLATLTVALIRRRRSA